MAKAIYHGKFQYAGGHPEASKPSSIWSKPQIVVTSDGIAFSHSGKLQFSISTSEIKSVRHETGAVGGYGGNNDQFVVVEITREGRAFDVRFKAMGMTQQKDAFALNAAVNASLISIPSQPDASMSMSEERLGVLRGLLAKGLISEAEFEAKQAEINGVAPETAQSEIKDSLQSAEAPARVSTIDPLDQIAKLAELHKVGVLTDEEFAAKKTELLGRI